MANMKGPYTDFEIVWADGAPSALTEQITSKTQLLVTESGVLQITNTDSGIAITCAPHTWKFVFQHPTLAPGPTAMFV